MEKDFRNLTLEELEAKRKELELRIREVTLKLPRKVSNIEPPANPNESRKEIIVS